MMAFLRSIFAVVAGLILAVITLSLFEFGSSLLFPLPPGVDPSDPADLRAIISQIPVTAYIIILIGWAVAAFVGAWLAGRLAGRAPLLHGITEAVLLLIAGITNLLALPHPIWVWVLGIAAFIGFGYAGARAAAKRVAAPQAISTSVSS
ncbi:MAG TPA: hypothetical protein VGJ22_09370 [Anaerolineales bacterium]